MKKLSAIISLFVLTAITSMAGPTAKVTLAWDPSPGTNIITNYRVYYGIGSLTYTNAVSAGTNLIVSVTNLSVGTTYFFAATAVDNNGLESDYSTEVSTVTPIPSPTGLKTPNK